MEVRVRGISVDEHVFNFSKLFEGVKITVLGTFAMHFCFDRGTLSCDQ